MRLSELSRRSGVSTATVKFYLRQGLLEPGVPVSKTQADYTDEHLSRLRLIRALVDVAGLELSAVRQVLDVLAEPEPERLDVLETAADALPAPGEAADDLGRVTAWIDARGWRIKADDKLLPHLAGAWQACDRAGVRMDEALLDQYADHAEAIAETDIGTVPEDATGALRQVVFGNLLIDPVIVILRRLAQQHLSVQAEDLGAG